MGRRDPRRTPGERAMTQCPDDRTLEQLLTDELSNSDERRLEAHLLSCDHCRRRLDGLLANQPGATDLAAALKSSDDTARTEVNGLFGPGETKRWDTSPEPLPEVPGYEIERLIGRGGMGVVYRARQVSLDRAVALKMIVAAAAASADTKRRFHREARMLAKLRHPNIVQVHEVGEWQPPSGGPAVPFFCMELMEAGAVARHARQPLKPRAAAELIRTLARAVHAAHAVGIVHRDLKPANILLDWPDGKSVAADGEFDPARYRVKISDFGLAHNDDPERSLESGVLVGTPAYMAPEQARGEACGPFTDVYGLGAMLYQLLTGRVPFAGRTAWDTLIAVQIKPLVPPGQIRAGLPANLEAICLKCLRRDASHRYASAEALADDLDRFLEGRPVTARPVTAAERFGLWVRRNPVLAGLAAVTAGSLLAGLVGTSAALVSARAGWREALDQTAKANAALAEVTRQRDRGDDYRQSALNALSEYWALLAEEPRLEQADLAPLRRSLLQKAAAIYEKLIEADPTDTRLARTRGEALMNLTQLRFFLGELPQAVEAARQAQAVLGGLRAAQPDDPQLLAKLLYAYTMAAQAMQEMSRVDEAAAQLDAAIALAESAAPAVRASAAVAVNLGSVYIARSTVRGQRGELAPAVADLQAAIAGYEAAAAKGLAADEVAFKLATAYFTHGVYLSEMPGRRGEADQQFSRAVEVFDELRAKNPDDIDAAERYAIARQNRAINQMGLRMYQSAAADLEAALPVFEELAAKKPSRFILRFYAGGALGELGECAEKLGRPEEAEAYLDRSAAALEKLARDYPKLTFIALKLGNLYRTRGRSELSRGNADRAAAWFEKAIGRLEPVTKAEPKNPVARRYLADSREGLSTAQAVSP